MDWLFLVGAILTEVAATLSLRVAATTKRSPYRWYAIVAVGYVAAFTFLSLSLQAGMPLGVAYGIWSAVGVALTAVFSRVFFRESLTGLMIVGIVLIMGGVLLIELGSAR
jgi:Membrane transporters of cations and cationic drugs